MIASLLWKEYREHRAVGLTLAVLAVGGLVIAAEFLAPTGWAQAVSTVFNSIRTVRSGLPLRAG